MSVLIWINDQRSHYSGCWSNFFLLFSSCLRRLICPKQTELIPEADKKPEWKTEHVGGNSTGGQEIRA